MRARQTSFLHHAPVLGWIACLVTIFFAYGAVMQTKWVKWGKIR